MPRKLLEHLVSGAHIDAAIAKCIAIGIIHFIVRLNGEHYLMRFMILQRWIMAIAGCNQRNPAALRKLEELLVIYFLFLLIFRLHFKIVTILAKHDKNQSSCLSSSA